jgi:hypothetical protein
MSQTSIERLTEYLAQLPPQSQALLMREFERALERGQDTAVATLVLDQLRKIVRKTEADEAPPPRTGTVPGRGGRPDPGRADPPLVATAHLAMARP